jgi:FlaA1/EpsC-like NDP-sugar epimerase
MRAVAIAATATAATAFIVVLLLPSRPIPRSIPFLIWPLALLGMAAVRFVRRLVVQARRTPRGDVERILIFGAGEVGSALTLRMMRDPASQFLPVGFIEDDRAKRNLQIHGVHVVGTLDDLTDVAPGLQASRIVIAVNNADAALVRRVSDQADEAGIGCMVLPKLSDTLRAPNIDLSTMRNVNVQDLIGRRPVDTDVRAIAAYVTGKRVLVTGAGGSIGSELCRQLHTFRPTELVMLDRDESALHAVELSIFGRALLQSAQIVLVDIRDQQALTQVFLEHQPDVVFHAAALKHLPLLERYPREALKSNVYGTLHVLQAAAATGVQHFVNISTDKAANPASALGHSKRLAEQLTSWYAHRTEAGTFLSVRFGNVLGSRGSVLHAFAAQIEKGGPVTVTDPDVTRFFMTIPEACQLVIQAGAIGRPGEALVLDMGEPVKIVDVADRMIAMSGKDVEVVFTGLREGEKLHEQLIAAGESDARPLHPMISHVDVPPLDPTAIDTAPWTRRVLGPPGAFASAQVGVPAT